MFTYPKALSGGEQEVKSVRERQTPDDSLVESNEQTNKIQTDL